MGQADRGLVVGRGYRGVEARGEIGVAVAEAHQQAAVELGLAAGHGETGGDVDAGQRR